MKSTKGLAFVVAYGLAGVLLFAIIVSFLVGAIKVGIHLYNNISVGQAILLGVAAGAVFALLVGLSERS